jgi:LysM repeat protein
MKCKRRNARSWFLLATSAALVLSMNACKTKPEATNVGILGSRDLVPPPYAHPTAIDTSREAAAQGRPASMSSQTASEPILPAAESFVPAESPVYVPAENVPQPENILSTPPAATTKAAAPASTPSSGRLAPPPSTENLRQYKIQKGDTLSGIAQCIGVKWQDIAALNPHVDPNRMMVGESLYLPSYSLDKPIVMPKSDKSAAKAASAVVASKSVNIPDDGVYTVVAGDSLWTISRRFKVNSDDIRTWNSLKTDKLAIGQKLKLKGAVTAKETTTKTAVKSSDATAAPATTSEQAGTENATMIPETLAEETIVGTTDTVSVETAGARAIDHLVSENDTLESIAMLYEVKLEDLLRGNPNIKSNADLVPNTTIKIAYPAKK